MAVVRTYSVNNRKLIFMNNMKLIEKRLDKLTSELCRLGHGGRCYLCGHPGTDTHHIVSRNHKRQRWNQDNLVYLCRTCHLKTHNENLTFGRDLDRSVKVWSFSELQELEKDIKQQIKEVV